MGELDEFAARAVQLGQRCTAMVDRLTRGETFTAYSIVSQPRSGLTGREGTDLDFGQAPAGSNDCGVQAGNIFIRRQADKYVKTLAEEPVGEVEQPGQSLACAAFRVRSDELVAVLEDQQAPTAGRGPGVPRSTELR